MGPEGAISRALENAAFVVFPEFEFAASRYDLLVRLKE
jgi:hypothetical protein